jgi:deoxyribose-phosphate aldolase
MQAGARELDMVMNIAALKSREYGTVFDDIAGVVETAHAHGAIVKVIIECGALDDNEKLRAACIVSDAGADFIKTSTGFGYGGVTIQDVRLLREHVAPHVKVKASGGIRTRAQALELLSAGADRLGTSAGVTIVTDSVDSPHSTY